MLLLRQGTTSKAVSLQLQSQVCKSGEHKNIQNYLMPIGVKSFPKLYPPPQRRSSALDNILSIIPILYYVKLCVPTFLSQFRHLTVAEWPDVNEVTILTLLESVRSIMCMLPLWEPVTNKGISPAALVGMQSTKYSTSCVLENKNVNEDFAFRIPWL